MKGQSFHRRKVRVQETPSLNFDELRARTVNALDKLGGQRFSAEPGGYSLENWSRGVNVLLDEFEEKAGAARLSPEYLSKRRDLNATLSKPVVVASIDDRISELRSSIAAVEGKIETERTTRVRRVAELKTEEARCSGELEEERRRVAGEAPPLPKGSLFSRLLGRSKTPAKVSENRIRELGAKLAALSEEIAEQKKQLKLVDLHTPGSPFVEDWTQLDSMQTRLKGLEAEKLERTQLVAERAEMMGSMAEAISRIE
ncbi:MAG: hypothetical protein JRN21_00620 [Nitrososphaerota archaeon]|nr:hypothetical protein [Nitrososphaerota archaeon]